MKIITKKPADATHHAQVASLHNVRGEGPKDMTSMTSACRQDFVFWVGTAWRASSRKEHSAAAVVFRDNVTSSMFQAVSLAVVGPDPPCLDEKQRVLQLRLIGIHEALQLAIPWCSTDTLENCHPQDCLFAKRVRVFQPSRSVQALLQTPHLTANKGALVDFLIFRIRRMTQQIERSGYLVELHWVPATWDVAGYKEATYLAGYTIEKTKTAHHVKLSEHRTKKLSIFPVIGAALVRKQITIQQHNRDGQEIPAPVRLVINQSHACEYKDGGKYVPLAPMRLLTQEENSRLAKDVSTNNGW